MTITPSVLLNTDMPLPLFIRGKVRDTYELGGLLLIIATDRISAFDSVLPCGIPDKGLVLNLLSAFWFEETKNLVPNHLVEIVNDVHCLDSHLLAESRFPYPAYLAGRSMIVKKAGRIPVDRGAVVQSPAPVRQRRLAGGLPGVGDGLRGRARVDRGGEGVVSLDDARRWAGDVHAG